MNDNIMYIPVSELDEGIETLDGMTAAEICDKFTALYDWGVENHLEGMLTELYGYAEVAGLEYGLGHVLRNCDPIAFRCMAREEYEEIDMSKYEEN